MASLMDGGDFDSIGRKNSKGGGGGDTVKIAIVIVLFVAAGVAFAFQLGLFKGKEKYVPPTALPQPTGAELEQQQNIQELIFCSVRTREHRIQQEGIHVFQRLRRSFRQ